MSEMPGGAAKKAPTKKTSASKAPAKKAPAKKAAAKKAPAKRAPAKKAAAKKTPAKKTAAKKTAGPVRISSSARRHPYRTLDDRVSRGLAWREVAPIDGQEEFTPAAGRPAALDLLSAQDHARVAELLPIRYGRMSASAFTFYRGAAAVMAYDLAQQPFTPGGTQICGDAHLSNFGFFGSPERDLVFDVNDFDETLPGPFEWDVKRLAASLVIAARDRGFKKKEARRAAVSATEGYRDVIRRLATQGNLDVWYTKIDSALIQQSVMEFVRQSNDKKLVKQAEAKLGGIFDKARTKTSLRAADKLTEIVDGKRQFRDDPPLLSREILTNITQAQVEKVYVQYKDTLQEDRRRLLERYQFVDLGHKVVGVGSVGTRAMVMLFEGRDGDDPFVLQVKQAQESVLEAYLRPSEFANHGQRVVEGQRYMQAASDIFLGWIRGPQGRDFYVRQLHDMKGSVDTSKMIPTGLEVYGRLCGATLARAHARGGDVVAIASYLGEDDRFAQAVARFGEAYADQSERDYAEMKKAIDSGALPALAGI